MEKLPGPDEETVNKLFEEAKKRLEQPGLTSDQRYAIFAGLIQYL